MKKKLFIALFIVAILGVLGYNYLYHEHRDVATSDAIASFNSENLLKIFQDSDVENDKEILDQVIKVTGVATSTSAYSITLDNKIFVEFDHIKDRTFKYAFKVNEIYTIKGRCLGYDDLLEEVKIDQALLENK